MCTCTHIKYHYLLYHLIRDLKIIYLFDFQAIAFAFFLSFYIFFIGIELSFSLSLNFKHIYFILRDIFTETF